MQAGGQRINCAVRSFQYRRGHRYLTLVYQIDAGTRRLVYAAKRSYTGESARVHRRAARRHANDAPVRVQRPYLNVIAECCGHAVRVLDRFHVMKKFGDTLNQVRRRSRGG